MPRDKCEKCSVASGASAIFCIAISLLHAEVNRWAGLKRFCHYAKRVRLLACCFHTDWWMRLPCSCFPVEWIARWKRKRPGPTNDDPPEPSRLRHRQRRPEDQRDPRGEWLFVSPKRHTYSYEWKRWINKTLWGCWIGCVVCFLGLYFAWIYDKGVLGNRGTKKEINAVEIKMIIAE